MKANLQDQQTLLDLAELDLENTRITKEVSRLSADDSLAQLTQQQLELSESLIEARNRIADLELDLKRAENDLELVENRINKDRQLLTTSSSPKDLQGIEHELDSLAKRKGELEEIELEVLEQLEIAQLAADEIQSSIEQVKQQSQVREEELKNLSAELKLKREQLESRRNTLRSSLSPDLVSFYESKLSRGVGFGKLVGRDCGVCRISITASILDEIHALPADELAECPSCQAVLVKL